MEDNLHNSSINFKKTDNKQETFTYSYPSPPTPDEFLNFLSEYGFNTKRYIELNQDIAPMSPQEGMNHFAKSGYSQWRYAFFDRYSDLNQLCADGTTAPWIRHSARLATGALILAACHEHQELGASKTLLQLLAPASDAVPALIIGDSHTAFLNQIWPMLAGGLLPAPIVCWGGSARGLINENSRGGYRDLILRRLTSLGQTLAERPVILKFGQVDIEFVFDMKRIKNGHRRYRSEEAQVFIEETIERFTKFIIECNDRCNGKITVMSILPPTLGNATLESGYLNAHIAFLNGSDNTEDLRRDLSKLDYPDIQERTALARFGNICLNDACKRLSIPFIDEFDALLGDDGVIHPDLADDKDHHMMLGSQRALNRIMHVAKQIRSVSQA